MVPGHNHKEKTINSSSNIIIYILQKGNSKMEKDITYCPVCLKNGYIKEIKSKEKCCNLRKSEKEHKDFYKNVWRSKSWNLRNFALLNKEFIENNFLNSKGEIEINRFKNFIGCSTRTVYRLLKRFEVQYKKRAGTSNPEDEIIEFIRTLDKSTEIIKNSRGIIAPLELDIYLPEYKLAIEYNGLTFHSQDVDKETSKFNREIDKNYHRQKTKMCLEKGIHLIHINEHLFSKYKEFFWNLIKINLNPIKIIRDETVSIELPNDEIIEWCSGKPGRSILDPNSKLKNNLIKVIRSNGEIKQVIEFTGTRVINIFCAGQLYINRALFIDLSPKELNMDYYPLDTCARVQTNSLFFFRTIVKENNLEIEVAAPEEIIVQVGGSFRVLWNSGVCKIQKKDQ